MIILLASQRSGTNMLRSILSKHPEVHCFPEVFNDSYTARSQFPVEFDQYFQEFCIAEAKADSSTVDLSHRTKLVSQYFDKIEQFEEASGMTALVDIKDRSLHHANGTWLTPQAPPTMIRLFARNSFKVIHLTRKNRLAMVLSKLRARKSGQHQSQANGDIARASFEVNPKKVLSSVNSLEKSEQIVSRWLSGAGIETLEIVYEDLFVAEPGSEIQADEIRKIYAFMGKEAGDLDLIPTLKKVSPKSMRDEVENFDELRAALEGTPYADYVK